MTAARSDLALKPCPFCGGRNLESGGDDKFVGARCLDCEACGPNHYLTGRDWNTRQPDREAVARIKLNASQLMRSYYEARGGHMVDGPTATAEIAFKSIETECNAILSLLSGAATKSDGGACGNSSQASQHHNVDLQPPPSDPSDVREALEDLLRKSKAKREQVAQYRVSLASLDHAKTIADGRILQLDQIIDWIGAALTRPLGGFVQGSIADGEQCNEQSAQGLSRAPKKISDDYITVEYISAYGGRCRDCADHDGTCPNNGLPCSGRHRAVEHMIAAINYGWANGYLPSTLDNAETDANAQRDDGLLSGVTSDPTPT